MWDGVLGATAAAVVGVLGLLLVLRCESAERYRERVDRAFAEVVTALGRRALELDAWTSANPSLNDTIGQQIAVSELRESRRRSPGGPLDADLQTAAEVACLTARGRKDRPSAHALAEATFALKRALPSWQIQRAGRIAHDIRRWRSGEISSTTFIAQMRETVRLVDTMGHGPA